MGSGPEVEEPTIEAHVEFLEAQVQNQKTLIDELVAKLQQVNLAFAAHLGECQGVGEEEPRDKRCL